MYYPISEASCLCSQGTKGVMQKSYKRMRSGRCAICGIARNREGKILKDIPKTLKSFLEGDKSFSSARGRHDDDDASHLLSVLRVVSQFSKGMGYEEEKKVTERVYTQLRLECNPLVDPDVKVKELPEEAYGRLYIILNQHLGPAFRNYVSHPAPPSKGRISYNL
ncbi:AP-1 adaptor complex mu subunit Apm1 [Hypoxylon texense]